MIAMIKTISGTWSGLDATDELTNWPTAAPKGLASVESAVALVRPWFENQLSLYLVGVERQKGCAIPIKICPNMMTP